MLKSREWRLRLIMPCDLCVVRADMFFCFIMCCSKGLNV